MLLKATFALCVTAAVVSAAPLVTVESVINPTTTEVRTITGLSYAGSILSTSWRTLTKGEPRPLTSLPSDLSQSPDKYYPATTMANVALVGTGVGTPYTTVVTHIAK